MTQDTWPQYKKYIQSLSCDTLKRMKKIKEDKVEYEPHILRKQGIFEKTEKELDYINEVIMNRE